MRILFMADFTPDPNSGAAGTELRTLAALKKLGHEIDEVWADDLPHRIRHWNLHYAFELPRALRAALARRIGRDYDVVHANQPHGWMAAKLWQTSRQRGVFIHRSHGLELHADETRRRWFPDRRRGAQRAATAMLHPLLRRNSRQMERWADGHIVSASLDAEFLEARGVERAKIAVIAQGLSDEYFRTPAPPLTEQRLRRVLYASQLAAFKAPAVVAAALRALAQDISLTLTWICGRNHHGDVRALLNGNERVELLGWMPV